VRYGLDCLEDLPLLEADMKAGGMSSDDEGVRGAGLNEAGPE
jgi:hypothetical protein